MVEVTHDFTHLWNGLPKEERDRLAPFLAESQLLHIAQVRQKAVEAHKRHMKELDDWMKNIEHELNKYRKLVYNNGQSLLK